MRPNLVGWFLVAVFLVGGVAFWISIPEIFIGQIWVGVALLLAVLYLGMMRQARAAQQLRLEGIPGRATIVEMEQTGAYVNHQPVVKLRLRIEATGVASFEVEKRVVVPVIALGALSSGRALSVYLDREDHERLTIDWGAAVAPMAVSRDGAAPVTLASDPAAVQEVLRILETHGIGTAGKVDLRQNPAARQAVADALRKHGVDAAHQTAAADPTLPVAPQAQPAEPLERLTKLMQLKGAQLISDEEFQQHKQRILDGI